MVQKFRILAKSARPSFVAYVALALLGCSGAPGSPGDARCNSTHFDVLRAVADDSEIKSYAKLHFSSQKAVFLWDGMPKKVEACGVVDGDIKIFRSSSLGRSRQAGFIVVEKMYFDHDAAFVEFGFPPTGKNADAFLRRRDGKWMVVERSLWES